jgi:hypothetical protein
VEKSLRSWRNRVVRWRHAPSPGRRRRARSRRPVAHGEPNPFFRTPSKNIYCGYGRPWLRCDISSGLKPKPQKPAGCDFDWGQTYLLSATGRVRLGCVSDSVFSPTSRVLPYGSRWSRGGITCLSKATGLWCSNRVGHGFFMSRQRSYRF